MIAKRHRHIAGWMWSASAAIMLCVLLWLRRLPHPELSGEPPNYGQFVFILSLAVSVVAGIAFTRRRVWAHVAMRIVPPVCLILFGLGSLVALGGPDKTLHELTHFALNTLRATAVLSSLFTLYATFVAWYIPLTPQKT